jgi:NitT/TauT family transport system substrate-binding protein
VFGDALPAGSLYTKAEFIRQNPNTVQALTNAMVRTLMWLRKASDEEVLKAVPPEYMLGERGTYLAAIQRSREGYSRDGLITPSGAEALYRMLRTFDPAVKEGPPVNLPQTYDMSFVQKALAKYVR